MRQLKELLKEKFNLDDSQFSHHESDLYVLYKKEIADFLKSINKGYVICMSNVEGQDWFGKSFIDMPFGRDMEYDM